MTLQQLKYAVVTAEKGTVSEAAAALYIAQPSLTKAIKELEKEMGITIFHRTNKGVSVSKECEVFLGIRTSGIRTGITDYRKICSPIRRETRILRIHTALFFCSKCFCRSHQSLRQRKL